MEKCKNSIQIESIMEPTATIPTLSMLVLAAKIRFVPYSVSLFQKLHPPITCIFFLVSPPVMGMF